MRKRAAARAPVLAGNFAAVAIETAPRVALYNAPCLRQCEIVEVVPSRARLFLCVGRVYEFRYCDGVSHCLVPLLQLGGKSRDYCASNGETGGESLDRVDHGWHGLYPVTDAHKIARIDGECNRIFD
jgi:hypothetical protein